MHKKGTSIYYFVLNLAESNVRNDLDQLQFQPPPCSVAPFWRRGGVHVGPCLLLRGGECTLPSEAVGAAYFSVYVCLSLISQK